MNEYLRILAEGGALTQEQAEGAMHRMMRGEAEPEEVAALLMGLRTRGETIDELVGFTRIMRAYAVPVACDDPHAIDLCGTGGDNTGTFNVSTAAAFVCAGAGVTVAKHGNRSVSSKCGSADVLEALGVRVELHRRGVEACLREVGIGFLFAPFFHPALRHVMPVRRKMGVRTFFNILGPLCNPAGVRRQLVGAFSTDVARRMAEILARLDAAHVVAVHSADGLDEISLSDRTLAFQYVASDSADHAPASLEIAPEGIGLARASLADVRGGTAADNATILRALLDGRPGPHRDIVLLNAAWALQASGRYATPADALAAARHSIDSGAAANRLASLVQISREVRDDHD